VGFNERENKRHEHSGVVASLISPKSDEKQAKAIGRPKAEREIKKRVTLAILPSLYDEAQKIAFVQRKSISEIVAECLTQYISANENMLKEYDAIDK